MSSHVTILSDLHLGPSRDEGIFNSHVPLCGLLGRLEQQATSQDCTVVLAGDVVDFLLPLDGAPLQPLDPAGAQRLCAAAISANDDVFDALARVAAKAHLVILAGNHDPELRLPFVRSLLERRLGGKRAGIDWVVGDAWGVMVGGVRVVVEHGDQYDPMNSIDHAGLRHAATLGSRGLASKKYKDPAGSTICRTVLPTLRRGGHGWAELLKPERPTVLPLLGHFLPPRELSQLSRLATPAILRGGLTWLEGELRTAMGQPMVRGTEGGDAQAVIEEWLRASEGSQRGRILSQASTIRTLRQVAKTDTFWVVDAPDGNWRASRMLIDAGADVVVMGHTHARRLLDVAGEKRRGLYVNTGTWANLLRLPDADAGDAEWKCFLDSLASEQSLGEAQPTWAEIQTTRDGATVKLLEIGGRGTVVRQRDLGLGLHREGSHVMA